MEAPNATRMFLGDERRWAGSRIVLYDVQALWGGRRIDVEWPNRAVIRVVERGAVRERRYEVALGEGEATQLLDLVIEQDFATIEPIERPGIPDEARPRIVLTNASGDTREVDKWAGVKDERFDRVYSALLGLEAKIVGMKPVYVGLRERGT